MKKPINIEIFNYLVSKIFVKLYEEFPIPTDINPLELLIPGVMERQFEDKILYQEQLGKSINATIQFLIDEGYVRVAYGDNSDKLNEFKNIVLTSKAFSILQNVPDSISIKIYRKSNIERLRSAIKSSTRIIATESIGPIIAQILSGRFH